MAAFRGTFSLKPQTINEHRFPSIHSKSTGDDCVKANYPKFGKARAPVPGPGLSKK